MPNPNPRSADVRGHLCQRGAGRTMHVTTRGAEKESGRRAYRPARGSAALALPKVLPIQTDLSHVGIPVLGTVGGGCLRIVDAKAESLALGPDLRWSSHPKA